MPSTTDALTPDSIDFDRTVHATEDLDWDATGAEPVTDSLREHVADGTCIEVPDGTYLVDERIDAVGLERWGLRATGDDVRLTIPEGASQRIFNIRANSRDIVVDSITFWQREDWATNIGNVFQVADGLLLRDVVYEGWHGSESNGGISSCNVYVFDPEGVGVIEGFECTGQTELVRYPGNTLTVFVGAESKGTIHIRDSHFANCGGVPVYASRCESAVRVEDCHFANNQNAHLRISGEGSWAKRCRFVWDISNSPNKGSFQATTGLVFESGYKGFTGGLAEGCEFVCRDSANNSGCLKVDGSHGAVTVRDCTFQVDADDAEPIWVDGPGDSHMIDGKPFEPWDVQLENVTVEGAGGWNEKTWHDPQHKAAVRIDGRDGSEWRGGSVTMANRDGCRLTRGTYRLESVSIDVGGAEIDAVDATVERDTEDSVMNEFEHELIVNGTGEVTHYEIDVSGAAGLVTTGEKPATPPDGGVGETVTEHDDGSSTLRGVVKSGGDTFACDGEVTDVRIVEGPDPVITVDGTELDLSQFRDDSGGEEGNDEPSGGDSGGEDSDESDGSGDDSDGESQRTAVEIEASGTKGYLEPIIFFDGEIADPPTGDSYTLFADRGEIAFSTRDGWRHEFTIDGDVVDVACPEGVTVTVDGEEWVEG